MGQSRGNDATLAKIAAASVLLLWLLAKMEMVDAATYDVGGPGGWTFQTDTWPNGKKFKAGDILVFNYESTQHNVVVVDKNGYTACTNTGGSQVYSSGKDQIRLSRGLNYFICSNVGHCQSGMKIAINAI